MFRGSEIESTFMKIALIHPYITVREVDSCMSELLGLLCLATCREVVFDDVEVTIVDSLRRECA